MNDRLSDDLVISFTKAAMAPLECVAEFSDAGNRYGFAVYFEHRERVVVRDLLAREMRDPKTLVARLIAVRSKLLAEGEKLNNWQGIPPQADC
ncbi:hypothetical protein [Laribacter hongkongensis]|uniref:hypothetical protein n=1 Tax=Laribacter hongkongensis TaxID=168471 RepID=UPI001EFDE932|nr:hypothetical protein [Laribacter hongkongensis]MCG8993743.1 hypothetical protein [Laribacter hongkongensis]MCG9001813.1 hypothetical protein [Laribacter hongkongensis]MCG9008125.1 hypothetical protein [Laribacter hongkongensis]MCG9017910.1 hypothetical protein [Laribacter hongkongensis]